MVEERVFRRRGRNHLSEKGESFGKGRGLAQLWRQKKDTARGEMEHPRGAPI